MVAKDLRAVVADFGLYFFFLLIFFFFHILTTINNNKGLAKVKFKSYAKTNCGTPGYTAPEILNDEQYSEKADIYSYGMVLWEIV